ncbi:phage tail assembly protein [Microbulbifer sp. VTAC004]|uniref:phage tail assembly protein n=1 Tax=Microbulbifer TaxID=48073 RepID=UPI00036102D6|nr:phage tail assembly protein [Microbulbifer variabilis]
MSENVIKLDFPVEYQGIIYSELQMRRPKVRDLLAIERKQKESERKRQPVGDGELATETYANLCEVSPAVIEDMDAADFKKLDETYEGFLS